LLDIKTKLMKKILLFSVLLTMFHLSFSPSSYAQNTNCKAKFEMKEASNASKTYHFINQSLPQNAKASWSFGDGNSSSEYSPTHTYTKSGEYRVCLNIWAYDSAKNQVTCQASFCDTLIIKSADTTTPPNCKAYFKVEKSAANASEYKFRDFSEGGLSSWYWTFGDGTSSKEQHPSHVYNKPGTYKVCLKIVTKNNCVNEFCQEIKVGEPNNTPKCSAEFNIKPNGDNTIVYNAQWMDSSAEYSWDFGDNTTGNGPTVTHKYAKPGKYQVCLIVRKADKSNAGSNTVCEDKVCKFVEVKDNTPNPEPCEPCRAGFTFKLNEKGSVQFFSKTGIINASYSWDFGDGTYSKEANPIHTYPNNSTKPFRACLTVTSNPNANEEESCSVTVCKSIVFKNDSNPNTKCSANFTYKIYTDNQYTKVYFMPEMQQGVSYSWDFGDGNTSTEKNPKHQYPEATTKPYQACLVVSSSACKNNYCEYINFADSAKYATGVNTTESSDLMIYPNPPKGQSMSIKWINGYQNIQTIQVYNAIGKLVATSTPIQQSATEFAVPLNTDELPSGVYFMNIETDKGITKQKFIID
jgi:PKD repeat protein